MCLPCRRTVTASKHAWTSTFFNGGYMVYSMVLWYMVGIWWVYIYGEYMVGIYMVGHYTSQQSMCLRCRRTVTARLGNNVLCAVSILLFPITLIIAFYFLPILQ